jgi:DNA polymerase-3 subunit epsilon
MKRRRHARRSGAEPGSCWALDVETTGLDTRRDEIISIAMVPTSHRVVRLGEAFTTLVRPVGPVHADGMLAHHIVPAELSTAPALAEVVPAVAARLAGAALVVHYAEIDVRFLRRAFAVCGVRWPRPRVIDTADLMVRLGRRAVERVSPEVDAPPTRLDAARAHVGLPPYPLHDALIDAVATAELYLVLTADHDRRERTSSHRDR